MGKVYGERQRRVEEGWWARCRRNVQGRLHKKKTKNQKLFQIVLLSRFCFSSSILYSSPGISTPSAISFHCTHNIGKTILIWSCQKNDVIIEHLLIHLQRPRLLYRILLTCGPKIFCLFFRLNKVASNKIPTTPAH